MPIKGGKPPHSDEQLIAELTARGYDIRRKRTYKTHSFEVDEDILKEFFEVQEVLNLKIKDAISEAMQLWVKTSRPKP